MRSLGLPALVSTGFELPAYYLTSVTVILYMSQVTPGNSNTTGRFLAKVRGYVWYICIDSSTNSDPTPLPKTRHSSNFTERN